MTEVRALTADDAPALREFFLAIPPEDRTFFFQDVNDPAVAERWAGDDRSVRRGAFADDDGRLLAFASLQPGSEWSSHVAEVVLVVGPDARRTGLGRRLAGTMLATALDRGYRKVSVLIPAENTGALEMFRKLGFDQEALLREQLCSPEDGSLHDVVVLAYLVDDTWAAVLPGGYEGALG
jgi:L-amino acid N-acyltransferase YncA